MRNEVIMVIRCFEPFQRKVIWKHMFFSFTRECLLLLDAAERWTLLPSHFCPSQGSPHLFRTIIEGQTNRATTAGARPPSTGEMWARRRRQGCLEQAQAPLFHRLACSPKAQPMYSVNDWIQPRRKSGGFAARQHRLGSVSPSRNLHLLLFDMGIVQIS